MTARPPRQPRPPMLTVAQAADELGVDPRQVYHWIAAQLLACVRYPTRSGEANGPMRIAPADVEAFKKRYYQPAT